MTRRFWDKEFAHAREIPCPYCEERISVDAKECRCGMKFLEDGIKKQQVTKPPGVPPTEPVSTNRACEIA